MAQALQLRPEHLEIDLDANDFNAMPLEPYSWEKIGDKAEEAKCMWIQVQL